MFPSHRLSIAPMMAYTDRHYRYMMRLFTRRTLLYTEMVVAETIHHNRDNGLLEKILGYASCEQPLAVQLGGDHPDRLVEASKICEQFGFAEINLNVGCPSDRVQKGRFGACLMKEPEHVAGLLAKMQAAVSIPVTVKHRLGVDDLDQYCHLHHFVETVSQSGTKTFIVHARKAWLKGLSPAQNRQVPPLNYSAVYQLKQDFPHLNIVINGGIETLQQAELHLGKVDGVMIGRAAYHHPQLFATADTEIFGEPEAEPLSDEGLIAAMGEYICQQVEAGVKISFPMKHLVGLFKNRPNARQWRQAISRLVQEKPRHFDLHQLYLELFGSSSQERLGQQHLSQV